MSRYAYGSSGTAALTGGLSGFIVTCGFRRERSATAEATARLQRLLPAVAGAAAAAASADGSGKQQPGQQKLPDQQQQQHEKEEERRQEGAGPSLAIVKTGGSGCVLLHLRPTAPPAVDAPPGVQLDEEQADEGQQSIVAAAGEQVAAESESNGDALPSPVDVVARLFQELQEGREEAFT